MSCSSCGSTEPWYPIPETGQVRCPGCFMTVPAPAEKTAVEAPAKPRHVVTGVLKEDQPVAKPAAGKITLSEAANLLGGKKPAEKPSAEKKPK